MKIKIIIFSYERKQMLLNLMDEIEAATDHDISYTIIDDGSSFVLDKNFHQFNHGGKQKFWRMWDYALRMLKNDKSDIFLFMPSDVSKVNFNRIKQAHLQHGNHAYAYNLINDGRTNCWNMIQPVQVDEHTMKVGFTDCGFFCNKQLLNRIGYYVNEINQRRFEHNEAISSGVGQNLTFRMLRTNCNMFTPTKSLVHHGDHESLMHPEHRKKIPLISK
jgi:hypothetical protein